MGRKKIARKFPTRTIGGERLPETPAVIRYKPSGMVLTFVGYGAYPYPCESRDKFPDAAVYGNDEKGAWTSEQIGPDGMPCLPPDSEVIA